jgi:prevent-host-death family protein
VFSDHQQVHAVSVTELDRNASAVLADVARGTRVIVTKHGAPSALIVSLRDGAEVMLAGSESFALLRREAHEQLAAGETTELMRWRPRMSRSG